MSVNQTGTLGAWTILTANNSYTGTTTVGPSTVLQVANGGTTGSLGAGNVVTNGALFFDRSDNITVSNTISGGGYVWQVGTGTATLSGSNSYSGGTGVRAGVLVATGTLGGGGDLIVGYLGGDNGTLLINGGVVIAGETDIGNNTGSSGTVTINSGSLGAGNLGVGENGDGTLNIHGGYVSASQVSMGGAAGYVGAATITGGTWATQNTFSLGTNIDGGFGTSVLNINGGLVTDATGVVGNASSTGTANVTGGTWNSSSSLSIGISSGTGVLNLSGNGVVTVNSGTGTVTLGAPGSTGTLNFSGGMLNAAAISGGSGTATINFTTGTSATFAPAITGAVTVNQTGSGTTVLTGSNSYTGPTNVTNGTLRVNGSIASSSGITLSSGAKLAGSGVVGNIGGAGMVAPGGNSILTASQIDPSGGLGFNFHFSQTGAPNYGSATASGNDLLHLTGVTPLAFSLTLSNTITIDFTGDTLQTGQVFYGGIFTDSPIADSMVNGATFDYTGLNGATVQYDGMTPVASAPFATGTVSNGDVMKFEVTAPSVPAASAWALAITGAGLLVAARRMISKVSK